MADFKELFESLRNPGDDGPSETIYDDLLSAYDHDVSTRDAKIGELTEKHSLTVAEVEALKAANYDLNSLIPPADGESGGPAEEVTEVQGLDALFESPVDGDDDVY